MARSARARPPLPDVIDVGPAPTAVPAAPLGPAVRTWTRADARVEDCFVRLGAAEIDEVHAMVARLRSDPLPALLCTPTEFHTPRLTATMTRAREGLERGVGVTIVDRLPLDEMSRDEARSVFWTLGHLLGREVAQKWDGTMLYHGVLAPNARHRHLVVPAPPPEPAHDDPEAKGARTRAAMTRAQRLRRVFAIEISQCPRCGAQLRVLVCAVQGCTNVA